jgi:DNA polymerase IV (family X)
MRRNDEIARRFEEFADRLEADGVAYKPSAYRRAAENIRECADPIEDLAAEGQDAVESINRVGDAIASKSLNTLKPDQLMNLMSFVTAFQLRLMHSLVSMGLVQRPSELSMTN